MNLWRKIVHSNFLIRLLHWEYWPFGIVQLPVFSYWLWLSIKARSLLFFSASNPGIPTGGMFGESKYDILKVIPGELIPVSILVRVPTTQNEVLQKIHQAGLSFPFIVKPDLGERGWMVARINNDHELSTYLQKVKIDFIVQELIDLPLEFGVFYRRYPSAKRGHVISVVAKEMLSVTGNGKATLKELILAKDRAKLQWKNLRAVYQHKLNCILPDGEKMELVSIGNHARGTKFLNGNHLINDTLSDVFDGISKHIDGFYFGRFDIRTASLEDLYMGRIKILELNGCGAEPAHIYHPGSSVWQGLRTLFGHWHDIYRISKENHERGIDYMPFKEGIKLYRKFRAAVKN